MITVPALFDTPSFKNASLNYKWDEDSYGYFLDEVENLRIANIYTELSYKATLAFGAALNEWIFWRLYQPALDAGITEPELQLHRDAIEATWAGAIDAHYLKEYDLSEHYLELIDDENPNSLIPEALNLAISFLSNLVERYKQGTRGIWDDMDKLTMLARHIAPDTKSFDAWIKKHFDQAIKWLKADYISCPIDNEDDTYDTAIDAPVIREFFFSENFGYENADIPSSINQFLSVLCWQENKLLSTPDDMIKEGFDGLPYRYEK